MSIRNFDLSGLTLVHNDLARPDNPYTHDMQDIVSVAVGKIAREQISRWPGYDISPLHTLNGFAAQCNVADVWYKDESQRFGLKSFKALGGSYAVAQQLLEVIADQTGDEPTMDDLFSRKYAEVVGRVTVATATDGNHGRSVAWGAQMFACNCVIYIHADVSEYREQMMAGYGADVRRIAGNYDDSLREAAKAALENNWIIVSDNSYEGYLEIPKFVTAGYTVMLGETVDQLGGQIPTHIFIQGGCGGLASSVCGYFWDLLGEKRPRLIVVEPEQANCLQRSAQEGALVVVDGKLETLMAGLACGEVSPLAWDILATGADDFVTLPEKYVATSMRLLAQARGPDASIEAGESAVAGVGTLLAMTEDIEARKALGIDNKSSILVFGTEGATDPDLYARLIAGDND